MKLYAKHPEKTGYYNTNLGLLWFSNTNNQFFDKNQTEVFPTWYEVTEVKVQNKQTQK